VSEKDGSWLQLKEVQQENDELISVVPGETAEDVRSVLMSKIEEHENQLYEAVGTTRENFDFEKVAEAARDLATEQQGYFLKKDFAEDILVARPPESTLKHLGYGTTKELLSREDIGEVFSALRFLESNEWMHETFQVAYTKFTPKDFEERPIELRVLGNQWAEVAEKYVAKKHHNVSHLKEFGVIFINPIAQTDPGKFIRDFALLLHYFHEIVFYSRLFKKYAERENFNQEFISLLRGDVPEAGEMTENQWLIIQRYLWKEDPEDPRLFVPHVNPEAMHWRKAEQDLVAFGKKESDVDLEFWDQLWSAAGYFPNKQGVQELVSFDLEDNAMAFVSKSEGRQEVFSYHQHEALWNKVAASMMGGYDKVEQAIIDNMDTGRI
ncbi:MAG: hypothetical protein QF775_04085, partial [archaeon]|nr:hypothetical protein [archaeon]